MTKINVQDSETEPTEDKPKPTEEPQAKPEQAESSPVINQPATQTAQPKQGGKFSRFWQSYKAHKKRNIPLTILVLIILILAIPFTRYEVLGLFIKRSFTVTVVDLTTSEPVTSANVSLAGQSAQTDKDGKATLTVKVGNSTLNVTKKYYQDFNQKVLVSTNSGSNAIQAKIQATGRQVPVKVSNKITGEGVENVTIKAADTEARTDKDGTATIVLPPDSTTQNAALSANGYNDTKVTIQVTDQKSDKNNFTITPTGKVYFLSKATGKIDVVKTNLDGTERQTVLAGTGKEEETGTVLLASRDWKYLALLARRDSKLAKLYVINTTTDKVSVMDQGDASFELVGWYDHNFVYIVDRNNVQSWQPNASSIKSYNPQTDKITVLDSTQASGTSIDNAVFETFSTANIHFLDNLVVYNKTWYSGQGYLGASGKKNSLFSANTDGTNKKIISSVDSTASYFGSVVQYSPDELYVDLTSINFNSDTYYSLKANSYTQDTSITQDDINKVYPTYLLSPSDKQTFWAESRDGKHTLFIGDKDGQNAKQIASLSPYNVYGWFTDDYVLVSKDSSELYIMPKSGGKAIKITDYHKPDQSYYGYGGGYGGL